MIHALALSLALLATGQATAPDKPGAIGIYGQTVTSDGCMAYVNNNSWLKKKGKCTFDVVLFGLQLQDIKCTEKVAGSDTVFHCTYTPGLQITVVPSQ